MLLSSLKKPRLWLTIAVAAMAGSLWLFFHNLLPVVVSPEETLLHTVSADGKIGAINTRGQAVNTWQRDSIQGCSSHGFAPLDKENHYGWIKQENWLIIPLRWILSKQDYHKGEAQSESRAASSLGIKENGMVGVNKQELLSSVRGEAQALDLGILTHYIGDPQGVLIKRRGTVILPLQQYSQADFGSATMASTHSIAHFDWINQRGESVIVLEWSLDYGYNSGGMRAVHRNQKWGWINREEQFVIPWEWDDTQDFDRQGFAAVQKNGKWGWINRMGEIVIPLRFGNISGFDSMGGAWAMEEGNLGRIDRAGRWIKKLDSSYKGLMMELYPSALGLLQVGKGATHIGCIDRNGQWLIPLKERNEISIYQASLHESSERYWLIYSQSYNYSLLAKSWNWLAGTLPFLRLSRKSNQVERYSVIYDDLAAQIIWTSDGREREVMWGIGLLTLALLAAGALFFDWRAKRKRCKTPLLLHASSNASL